MESDYAISFFDLVSDVRKEIYHYFDDDHATQYSLMRSCAFFREEMLPYLRRDRASITSINASVGSHGHVSILRWLCSKHSIKNRFELKTVFCHALSKSRREILDLIEFPQFLGVEQTSVLIYLSFTSNGVKVIDRIPKIQVSNYIGRSLDTRIIAKYFDAVRDHNVHDLSYKSSFWIIIRNIANRDDIVTFKYFFPPEFFESRTNRYGEPEQIIFEDMHLDGFSARCDSVAKTPRDLLKTVCMDGAVNILRYLLSIWWSTSQSATIIMMALLLELHTSRHPKMHLIVSTLLHTVGAQVIDMLGFGRLDEILESMNPYMLKLWSKSSLAVYIDVGSQLGGTDNRWRPVQKSAQARRYIHTLAASSSKTVEDELDEMWYDRPTFEYRITSYREFFEMIRGIPPVFECMFYQRHIVYDIIRIASIDIECAGHVIDEGIKRKWIDSSIYQRIYFNAFIGTNIDKIPAYVMWCARRGIQNFI